MLLISLYFLTQNIIETILIEIMYHVTNFADIHIDPKKCIMLRYLFRKKLVINVHLMNNKVTREIIQCYDILHN
jgi:hypothetical protein